MTSARSLSSHTYNEGPEESERLCSDVTKPHMRHETPAWTHTEEAISWGEKKEREI